MPARGLAVIDYFGYIVYMGVSHTSIDDTVAN